MRQLIRCGFCTVSTVFLLQICLSGFVSGETSCLQDDCKSRKLLDTDITLKLNNLEQKSSHTHKSSNATRLLDIVIAHHSEWNEAQIRPFWDNFLNISKIQELRPYVYVYCQNPEISRKRLTDMFGSVLDNGEVIMLDNKGREGRIYLHHIVNHYDDLARHTFFSQDDPGEAWLPEVPALPRMLKLFTPDTGVLALSEVYVTSCEEGGWVDSADVETHLMYETYAMIVGRRCPAEGFVGMYKGEFLASSRRIRKRSKVLYREMLQLIEADLSHPVHNRHNADQYKDMANPYIGHVYERAWSLLLDCHGPTPEHWIDQCRECEASQYTKCSSASCQCIDHAEADVKGYSTINLHLHNVNQKGNGKPMVTAAQVNE